MQNTAVTAGNKGEKKQSECIPLNIVSTVGNTDEPIMKVLKEHPVKRAFFLASGKSKMERILALTKEKGVESCVEAVKDAEDIHECYLASKRLLEKAGAKTEPQNILLNYTGGTKTMAAASVLAASDFGIGSIYVGGEQRDSAGRVISGFEKIVRKDDTKKILLVEEKRNALYFFNNGQYETAEKIATDAASNATGNTKDALELMAKLASVYAQWDLFKHKPPEFELLKNVADGVKEYYTKTGLELMPLRQLEANLAFYEKLSKRGKSKPKELVADLLANADRRLSYGRYDDAVARLYRALEMFAQSILREKYEINTSDLKPYQIPENADSALKEKTQFGLKDDYELLILKKDPLGTIYLNHARRLKKVTNARNYSILAHGSDPIGRENAVLFCDATAEFFSAAGLNLKDYPGAIFCKFSEIPDEISDK